MHGSGVDGTDDHRDQRLIEGEAEDQDTGQNHKRGHWRFDYEELPVVESPVDVRQLCAVGDVQPSVQQGVGQQDGRVEGSAPPVYPLVNEQSYYKEQKCDGDRLLSDGDELRRCDNCQGEGEVPMTDEEIQDEEEERNEPDNL